MNKLIEAAIKELGKGSINEAKYSKDQINKAVEIALANDGNMTKATKMIEKIAKGLSDQKDVADALRLANESVQEKTVSTNEDPLVETYDNHLGGRMSMSGMMNLSVAMGIYGIESKYQPNLAEFLIENPTTKIMIMDKWRKTRIAQDKADGYTKRDKIEFLLSPAHNKFAIAEGKKEYTLRSKDTGKTATKKLTDKEAEKLRDQGIEVTLKESKGPTVGEPQYGVYSKGGSIGSKNSGQPLFTGTKEEAKTKAASMRKGLSKGEREYYKMSYIVKPIKESFDLEEAKGKYKEFMKKALEKYGVKSPAELEGEKKKSFFDYIDKHWDGKDEKPEPEDKEEK